MWTRTGAAIQVWQFAGTANQWWRLTPVDEGGKVYTIACEASDKVLELEASAADQDGAPVQLSEYKRRKNQQWELQDCGGGVYVLKNCAPPKVLDLTADQAAKDGGKVQGWQDVGLANQRWLLLRREEAGSPDNNREQTARPGAAVETMLPLMEANREMRLVWIDPTAVQTHRNYSSGTSFASSILVPEKRFRGRITRRRADWRP